MILLAALLSLGAPPLVIAHRGASGLRPEHTLDAYSLAIEQGADYIEPDLVLSKDGVLVARHENEISGTTDVAKHPEFADRRTTKTIDGERVTGWFTEDFTLAELKTLRCRERLPELRRANAAFDGQETIPTFQEVIDLVTRKNRKVGIYPETKHPSYFRAIGLPLEEPLVAAFKRNGYVGRRRPVYVQSFEVDNLRRLNGMTDVPLVQLLNDTGAPPDLGPLGDARSYLDLSKPEGLRFIRSYADAVGLNKNLIIPRYQDGGLRPATSVVADAHALGLKVHAWTFRDEDVFLPKGTKGKPAEELRRFFAAGVDGVFADNPATALAVRASLAR